MTDHVTVHGPLALQSARQGGVITRAQALAAGYSRAEIDYLLCSGAWHRVRRGCYVVDRAWASYDDRRRHVLQIRAVLLAVRTSVVVSHQSAAVMHDLPLLRPDLSCVHVTREDRATRTEAGVKHHIAVLLPEDCADVQGMQVTSVARTATDLAFVVDHTAALVVVDAALARGVTREEMRDLCDRKRHWHGARRARRVVDFGDGRSESPGESWCRLIFHEQGLPAPLPQAVIRDQDGGFVARVDFLFVEQWTIIEFDGKSKYGAEGQDVRAQLLAEKRRTDRLTELGYEVVRLCWEDLFHPARVAAVLKRAFARAALRHGR